MRTYLNNVEYAVKKIFSAINHDRDRLVELTTERSAAIKKPEFLQELGWKSDLHEDFDEYSVMNYFDQAEEARKGLKGKLKEIDTVIKEASNDINIHRESVSILCGTLLQFAKQGISICHTTTTGGLPSTCPRGRYIGSEFLSNIIWQARNHALHYEESPRHNNSVVNCFANLESYYGSDLSLIANPGTNLSKKVIDLLGWSEYSKFEEDMLSLA